MGKRKADQSKWVKNVHDERAVANGCWFDEGAAVRVVDFFRKILRHSKGEWGGRPFELLDWERYQFIYPVFGWRQEDGFRRIRRADAWIAKKNGKSTLGAGLGLYLLIGDGEKGAEVYSAATKKEQAAIVHAEAINMVKASTQLLKHLRINESSHVITHDQAMARYAALSAEAKGAEGLNAHGLIIDELHAWTDKAFWNAIRYSMAGRRQPLTFVLSTAGIYNPESIGHIEYTYATKWISGDVDNQRYYAFVAEADPEDAENIEDPEIHKKANPSYGVTIDPEEMLAEARLVKDKPSERNNFLRYRLNIWVESDNPWIDISRWDACLGEFGEDDLVGQRCFGGLDLASKRDIVAFVLLFPPTEDDPKWRFLPRFFAPRDNAAELEAKYGVKYLEWERKGMMVLTPGTRTDYDTIRKQINDDRERFDLTDIGADRWNLEYLRQKLDPDGEFIVEYGQNYQDMSPPFKELESLILDRQWEHDGNEVMRWMVGNVTTIENSNEDIRPCKKKSTGKIDGVVGAIMALGRAMVEESYTSVYDTDELLVL